MKRYVLLAAIAVLTLICCGAASVKEYKQVDVSTGVLENEAAKWGQEEYNGNLKLNDPSEAPKLPGETTAPSQGKKRYKDNKKYSETTSTSDCPQPNCGAPPPPENASPPAGYPFYNLALVNNGSSWTHDQLAEYASVMQDVLNTQHVYKWGVGGTVEAYDSVADWMLDSEGRWPVFVDGLCPDCDGEAYHKAITSDGVCIPFAQVQDWSDDREITEILTSHETLEMVDNPVCNDIDRVVQYGQVLYLVESVDPVEDYSYPFEGHVVTNWQFPSYFQFGTSGSLNYMGLPQNPLFPVCGPNFATTFDPGSDYQEWIRSQRDESKYYNCLGQPTQAA